MDESIKIMIELTDLQVEIFNKMVRKYPRTNTMGGFTDLVEQRSLYLNGTNKLNYGKDVTFLIAFENLICNLKRLNLTLRLPNYEDLINRVNEMRKKAESLDLLNLFLGVSQQRRDRIGENSIEKVLLDSKFFYDLLISSDIESRHLRFEKYYNQLTFKLKEVMTISEACDKYKFNIDTIRKFLNRGANTLIENVDYKKSGGTWLISESGIAKYMKTKKSVI